MNPKAFNLTAYFALTTLVFQSSLVGSEYTNCPNQPFLFIDAKCKVTKTDCTEIVCQKVILSTNLKITAKFKKCYKPVAVDVSITTASYEWFEKFTSSQMSRDIPHSGDPSTKLRLRVSLDNTTRIIRFKLALATGLEQHGRFDISSSTLLVEGDLKRSTNDCAPTIREGQDTLSGGEIAGVIVGSIIGFILLCVFCFWLVSCFITEKNYEHDECAGV